MNEIHEASIAQLRDLLTPFYRDRGWTLGTLRAPHINQQRAPDFIVLGYDDKRRTTLFAWWCEPVRDARELDFLGDLVRRWQPIWTPQLPEYERVVGLVAQARWPTVWLERAQDAGLHPVTPFDLDVDAIQRVARALVTGVSA